MIVYPIPWVFQIKPRFFVLMLHTGYAKKSSVTHPGTSVSISLSLLSCLTWPFKVPKKMLSSNPRNKTKPISTPQGIN